MKHKHKLLLPLSAIFALSSVGHSQDNAPELSPISVLGSKSDAPTLSSGMKTSMPLNKAPQSLSIMTNDQFKAQGLNSVGDIINYTPGIINSQGEGHRDAVVIRGARTTADFYVDGIRDDVQYYRPLYNVEQVEVLRGSNALLSGFGGGYGLVNRVAKKGVIGETFGQIQGSIDTFGETNVQLDNNFITGDNSALRVNMFTENLENHRDFYYGDSHGVNPTFRYQFDGGTLDLSYEYLNQERFIDRGIPTSRTTKEPVESLKNVVFGDASENYSTHEAHIFRALLENQFTDNFIGRLRLTHNDHDKLYQNFYANSWDESAGTAQLKGYKDTTQRDTTTLSAELVGEIEMGGFLHNLIAGFEYIDTENKNDRYMSDFYPFSGVGGSPTSLDFTISRSMINRGTDGVVFNNYTSDLNDMSTAEVSILSIYLQDEIAIMDNLDLILGARYNEFDFDDTDHTSNSTDSDTDSEISPKVGLVFNATETLTLYGMYSESMSPRGDEQYASLKTDEDKQDPNTFENLEAGVKFELGNGMNLSASYFQLTAVKPDYINATSTVVRESETSGVEVQLSGSLSENWYTSIAYTNLDAETNDGGTIVLSQEAPEHVFSIWNNYMVSDRFSVNLGIIYQDESIIDIDDYGTSKDGAKLPDYTRVDLGAAYALTDNTRVQLNVENVFDEVYFPTAHDTDQATVGAPLNAMLTITSSF
jgi:catecholate siderophore receptor